MAGDAESLDVMFITEKPAKALLNLRGLIMLASPGALTTQRSLLGFQTFGSVLNETCDDILDATMRVPAALAEASRLAQLPRDEQAETWRRAVPLLIANQCHLLCGGLQNELAARAREVLAHMHAVQHAQRPRGSLGGT